MSPSASSALRVASIVSFYSFLQVPVDAVRVCTGPICDCAGLRELLTEGAIEVAGLGHCELAPVVLHGDDVVGGVTHSTNSFLLEPDYVWEPPDPTQDVVVARLEASGLTGMGGGLPDVAQMGRGPARAGPTCRDRQRRRGRARHDRRTAT